MVKLPLFTIHCNGDRPQLVVKVVAAVRLFGVTVAPPLRTWLARVVDATVCAPAWNVIVPPPVAEVSSADDPLLDPARIKSPLANVSVVPLLVAPATAPMVPVGDAPF